MAPRTGPERARQGRDDFGSEPKYPSCRSPSVPGRRLGALENSPAKNNVTSVLASRGYSLLSPQTNDAKYARSSAEHLRAPRTAAHFPIVLRTSKRGA